jgi:4-hydroxy-3-methylbut-2-en-1-yl diphosphate synthase IspG/GcpE
MLKSTTTTFVFLAALATLGATVPHQYKSVQRSTSCSHVPVGKAVYILTNEAKNAVVALPIAHDGTLSNGTVTSTAGAGGIAIDGMTNSPLLPDALLSQSSLTVVGNVSYGP